MINSERHLKMIAVQEKNYLRLKHLGFASESFNKVLERLLDEGEQKILQARLEELKLK